MRESAMHLCMRGLGFLLYLTTLVPVTCVLLDLQTLQTPVLVYYAAPAINGETSATSNCETKSCTR